MTATGGSGPVHNHPPNEPWCNERTVNGRLRGACLTDDGVAPPHAMSGLARAVVSTLHGLRRATAIEPSPEVVTLYVHHEDWYDPLACRDRQAVDLCSTPRKFMGYPIQVGVRVPPGQVRVVIHHEIMAGIR